MLRPQAGKVTAPGLECYKQGGVLFEAAEFARLFFLVFVELWLSNLPRVRVRV